MQEKLDFEILRAETKEKPSVIAPNLINYIPHKPPIVMVDRIFRGTAKSVLTGLRIEESNLFVENGLFSESGLIENIAQSAAAGVGMDYVNNNLPIPLGFIGAVKNLQIFKLPAVGEEIFTFIKETNEVFGITIIEGTIFNSYEIIATCEMKVLIVKS